MSVLDFLMLHSGGGAATVFWSTFAAWVIWKTWSD